MIKFIPLLFGAIITASIVVSTPAFAAPVKYTLNTFSYNCTPSSFKIDSMSSTITGDSGANPKTMIMTTPGQPGQPGQTVPVNDGKIKVMRGTKTNRITETFTVTKFDSTTILFGDVKLKSKISGFHATCRGSASYSAQ